MSRLRERRRKMASPPLHSTKRIFQSLSSLISTLYLFNVWSHVANAESDHRFCNLSHVPTSSHLPCVHPGHLRSSGSVIHNVGSRNPQSSVLCALVLLWQLAMLQWSGDEHFKSFCMICGIRYLKLPTKINKT